MPCARRELRSARRPPCLFCQPQHTRFRADLPPLPRRRLSADGATLTDAEQAAWLLAVNQAAGRGSEHRAALAAREARGGAPLTRADFHGVYRAELAMGKF